MTTKVTLQLKKVTGRLFGRVDTMTIALAAIPIMVAMTACTGQLSVGEGGAEKLASTEVTKGQEKPIFPDAVPSVADGSVYWKQNNCASCHGDAGKGSASVDLSNAEWMRARKPVDQYMTIAFGKGKDFETPTLTETAQGGHAEPVVKREFEHEAYAGKLSRRQIWDLVFYSRSLAVPLLLKEDYDRLKIVFGANCGICHGTKGAGDGPINKGLVLQPAPANFNQFDRFYDRTDEMLWDHIANGIKWEGMPNFLGKQDRGNKFKFDAESIWLLVQYVRTFSEDSQFALEKPENPNAPLPGTGKIKPAGAPAGVNAVPAAEVRDPVPSTTTAPASSPATPAKPVENTTTGGAPPTDAPAGPKPAGAESASTTPAPAGAPAQGGQAPNATPAH